MQSDDDDNVIFTAPFFSIKAGSQWFRKTAKGIRSSVPEPKKYDLSQYNQESPQSKRQNKYAQIQDISLYLKM